jgi:hypothetical protein
MRAFVRAWLGSEDDVRFMERAYTVAWKRAAGSPDHRRSGARRGSQIGHELDEAELLITRPRLAGERGVRAHELTRLAGSS